MNSTRKKRRSISSYPISGPTNTLARVSSSTSLLILFVLSLFSIHILALGIPAQQQQQQQQNQRDNFYVPIGTRALKQQQQLSGKSDHPNTVIASSFSASFLVRDRIMKNREVMNGIINVNNVLQWDETEAIIHYFDHQDESSDKTMYLYRGLLAMKHHKKLKPDNTQLQDFESDGDTFIRSVVQMEHDQEEQCVDDEADIPPLEHLFQSLVHMKLVYQPPSQVFSKDRQQQQPDHNSTPVYDREVHACIKQNLTIYSINFSGQSYVLCMSPSSDHNNMKLEKKDTVIMKPERIIGKEFLIDVLSYSPQRMINWLSDKTRDVVQKKCSLSRAAHMRPKRSFRNNKYDERMSLESDDESWFNSYSDTCRYEWMRDGQSCQKFESSNTVVRNQQQKVCIFLHGAGNDPVDAGPPVHSYPEYWGYVEHYTPQCSERWFIREDTKTKGWDSEQLQRAYCALALVNQTEGDTVIRDKIIFAHSMGNVILADAIQNGLCSIDVKTTSWYETQGALLGSKAAQTVRRICHLTWSKEWVKHVHPLLMKWVITKAGYCIPGTNHSYPVYDTLDPSYEKLKGMADIARKYVKGALCGHSAFGLTTLYSLPLSYFSQYTSYEEDNDAIVPLTSCDEIYKRYSDKPSAQFYSAGVNHADGTCRNGNGWWGRTRMPCSWYTDKI